MTKRKTAVRTLCFCAVFAALTCVATLISIPLPVGYFNLGDTIVIAGAWCLGLPGIASAAIGSALADVFLGAAIYAPATAVIKGLMALIAFLLCQSLSKFPRHTEVLLRAAVALLCEVIMVGGYLLYDAFAIGYGMGALASIGGNALQGLAGIIGSVVIFSAIEDIPSVRKLLQRK
ncbi:MAG: ECF transporter S component [Ruminococcaceae bacterium]|nr:ECF transporter S component [Oscillospiraceae bacterium]